MLKDDMAALAIAQGQLLGIRGHDEVTLDQFSGVRSVKQSAAEYGEYEKGTWIGLQPGDVFPD